MRRFNRFFVLPAIGSLLLMQTMSDSRQIFAQRHRQTPNADTTAHLNEEQAGEPDTPVEALKIEPSKAKIIQDFVLTTDTKGKYKDAAIIADKMLKIAQGYVGVSRASNSTQVGQYLDLFGLTHEQPFCASGVCYVACRAYCETKDKISYNHTNEVIKFHGVLPDIRKYYFFPSPSCGEMMRRAMAKRNWKTPSQVGQGKAKPGWLVFYNWKLREKWANRIRHPQHVGIVARDEPTDSLLHTIEFNTSSADNSNGGTVSNRDRDYKYIVGYIATY